MTAAEMAKLHGRCFTTPRPWTAKEFAALLDSRFVFVVGDARAFAMGRVIADEAELLTIATAPDLWRTGLGRERLSAFENLSRDRGAATAFLEVAADNSSAITLYESAGYTQTGCREGYYHPPHGPAIDALVMNKAL